MQERAHPTPKIQPHLQKRRGRAPCRDCRNRGWWRVYGCLASDYCLTLGGYLCNGAPSGRDGNLQFYIISSLKAGQAAALAAQALPRQDHGSQAGQHRQPGRERREHRHPPQAAEGPLRRGAPALPPRWHRRQPIVLLLQPCLAGLDGAADLPLLAAPGLLRRGPANLPVVELGGAVVLEELFVLVYQRVRIELAVVVLVQRCRGHLLLVPLGGARVLAALPFSLAAVGLLVVAPGLLPPEEALHAVVVVRRRSRAVRGGRGALRGRRAGLVLPGCLGVVVRVANVFG
mmetsp:Transcript_40350/g.108222  ORF Transcript_40350/g.108222 Transcript_40350/m.108222 type:complete len:288 (-) Transcript_40350:1264-2127(-)